MMPKVAAAPIKRGEIYRRIDPAAAEVFVPGQADLARRDLLGARSLSPEIVDTYARWGLAIPAGLLDPRE